MVFFHGADFSVEGGVRILKDLSREYIHLLNTFLLHAKQVDMHTLIRDVDPVFVPNDQDGV